MTTQEGWNVLSAAFVRYVFDLDAGDLRKNQGIEVPSDSRARRSIGQLIRVFLRRVDQIIEGFVRGFRADRKSVRGGGDKSNGIEVFIGIICHVLESHRGQDHSAEGIHQNTVSILWCIKHGGGGKAAGRASFVDGRDRSIQHFRHLFSEDPAGNGGETSGRKSNHHFDGSRRILFLRPG